MDPLPYSQDSGWFSDNFYAKIPEKYLGQNKMNTELAGRGFWEKYWETKPIIQAVGNEYGFHSIFERTLKHKKYKTMIEIGGFPGYYAIYFKKVWGYKTTLFDYLIYPKIVNNLLNANGLKREDINIIKADFFKYKDPKKYDIVFSLGFIEHSADTENVILRHWRMVHRGGQMIIGIPNFLGINGLYQLLFDPSILNVHNLDSMNITRLRSIVKKMKPKKTKVFYVSTGLVWLEKIKERNILLRILTRILNAIGTVLSALRVENKMVSTHIFIVAEK
jgi:hypothetical protein